jgi:hypothetical protein
MAEGQAAAPATTAAPVTPPAATTTSQTLTAPPPAAEQSWMAGFSEDQKGYTLTKGYKSPSQLVDSYRELEKMMGGPKERLMTLPERFYDDSGKITAEGRAIYERLGSPKEAKEYGLEKFVPKEGGDPKLMEEFSRVFHEQGVTAKQAENIAKNWNEYQERNQKALREQAQLKLKESDEALKKEWGTAFEQNKQIAKEGAIKMGMTKEEIIGLANVLGEQKAMNLLKNLGQSTGEAAFVTGASKNTAMEPAQANFRIKELMKDKEWGKRFNAGGAEEIAEWTRLHAFARG